MEPHYSKTSKCTVKMSDTPVKMEEGYDFKTGLKDEKLISHLTPQAF